MDSENRVLSIVFEIAKIACSLGAFIAAMVLGASWKLQVTSFFNVTQLVVVVYAIIMLVIRIANGSISNLWKIENIVSMVLASLEFAAASVWVMNIPENSPTAANPASAALLDFIQSNKQKSEPESDTPAMISMVVFGYITGVVCLFHAVYVILTN